MNTSTGNDYDRKLFAGGLDQEATEKDITDYFGEFGEVTSVNLKMDKMTGTSRGFAFVEFKEVDTLTAVMSKDHVIMGKKVVAKKVHYFNYILASRTFFVTSYVEVLIETHVKKLTQVRKYDYGNKYTFFVKMAGLIVGYNA